MGKISKWSNLYTKEGKLIKKAPVRSLSYQRLLQLFVGEGAVKSSFIASALCEKPNPIYIPRRKYHRYTKSNA